MTIFSYFFQKVRLLAVVQLFMLIPLYAYGGVIFQDNFDTQSSTWNIGQGGLTTPPGQEGTWSFWDRIQTSCTGLPAYANNWLMYMDPTGGVGGGKAIKTEAMKGCTGGGYEATPMYIFGANHQEIYMGFHMKFDAGWKRDGDQIVKYPYRFHLTDDTEIYYYLMNSTFNGNAHLNVYNLFFNNLYGNGGEQWDTGIAQRDFYDDHNWHWFEIRIKLNSTGSASDGSITNWIDGVKKGEKFNEKFYGGAGPLYFKNVMIHYPGNSQAGSDWVQTNWLGVWLDNFKVSTQYMGPSGVANPVLPAPTALTVH